MRFTSRPAGVKHPPMPNKRDPAKESVGGYFDQSIKQAIKKAKRIGLNESNYVEGAVICALIKDKFLTQEEVEVLASNRKLRDSTLARVLREGLWKSISN